jgi:hypothetical protein
VSGEREGGWIKIEGGRESVVRGEREGGRMDREEGRESGWEGRWMGGREGEWGGGLSYEVYTEGGVEGGVFVSVCETER